MKPIALTVVLICLAIGFSSVLVLAAENQPEVLVELSKNRVYEGDSVLYRVTLNHVENPSPPQLVGFDDFDVTPAGQRSLDSRRITIINGRRTETVRYGRAYDYQLTPRKTGQLTIPAPTANVAGQVLRGRELTLQVVGAEDQDVVLMEITSDRQAVYPTQPFTVTLSVTVKALPDAASSQEPLGVQRTPPVLTIPWASDERLPDGLEPAVEWRRWLGKLQNRRGIGFNVNNLQQDSIFSLFESRSLLAFRPEPQRVLRTDQDGNPIGYWKYEFSREFVPQSVGQFTFGPANVKGTFATGLSQTGRLAGEDIYAVARPITVTVKDVPLQGRPEWYIGAVGQYQLNADLAPKQAKVGDPMTLTVSLQGQGTLANAFAPDLAKIPEIADAFKLYEATEEIKGSSGRFTYALRPRKKGIEEFPSVPVAYFDVDTDRYVTLRTDSIPIQVTKAERLSEGQIVSTPAGASGGRQDLGVRREGIFVVNVTDPSAVRDESVRPGRWLLGLGGIAGLYAVVALLAVRLRRFAGDKALVRRRSAAARARGRLRHALAELRQRGFRAGADPVQAALVGLVADVADVAEAGLTPKDVSRLLHELGLEADLVNRVETFLETCDAAQYGGSDMGAEQFGHEAEDLLGALLKALKTRRLLR